MFNPRRHNSTLQPTGKTPFIDMQGQSLPMHLPNSQEKGKRKKASLQRIIPWKWNIKIFLASVVNYKYINISLPSTFPGIQPSRCLHVIYFLFVSARPHEHPLLRGLQLTISCGPSTYFEVGRRQIKSAGLSVDPARASVRGFSLVVIFVFL